jgi:hypothetical protein
MNRKPEEIQRDMDKLNRHINDDNECIKQCQDKHDEYAYGKCDPLATGLIRQATDGLEGLPVRQMAQEDVNEFVDMLKRCIYPDSVKDRHDNLQMQQNRHIVLHKGTRYAKQVKLAEFYRELGEAEKAMQMQGGTDGALL